MAVLEQEGYLAQPHTSAGRIPTDKGYRFFVDHLGAPGSARRRAPRAQVGDVLRHRPRRARADAAPAPAACSPGSPTTPRSSSARRAERATRPLGAARRPVGAARRTVVVVLVATARSRAQTIELAADTSDDRRRPPPPPTSHAPAASGQPLGRRGRRCRRPATPSVDQLCARGARRRSQPGRATSRVYVGGTSPMASAFDAVDIVARRAAHPRAAVRRGRRCCATSLDRGLSVAIGAEHGVEPLSACSVVVAPDRGRRRARSARSACSARPA